MISISFNKSGGPITVELSTGNAQTGSYELRLWEADKNQIVMREHGNFLNPDDDSYKLPEPNSLNNGRRVQAVITVALIPPINKYSAALTVRQDGNELGQIPISGTSDQPSVILNLYATIQASQSDTDTTPAAHVASNPTDDGGAT